MIKFRCWSNWKTQKIKEFEIVFFHFGWIKSDFEHSFVFWVQVCNFVIEVET